MFAAIAGRIAAKLGANKMVGAQRCARDQVVMKPVWFIARVRQSGVSAAIAPHSGRD